MTSRIIRRSSRLSEAGYYKEDGTPNTSYRERIFRVFKRRPYVIYEDDSISSCSSYSTDDGGNNYFGDYVQDFLQKHRNNLDDTDNEPIPLLVQDNGTQTTWTGAQATLIKTQTTWTGTQTTWRGVRGNFPEAGTPKTSTIRARKTNTTSSCSCLWIKIGGLLLILLLNFGLIHVYTNFRVQDELKTFQPWDKTFCPWSSAVANFALESQGAKVLCHLSSDTYWPGGVYSIRDILSYWWYANKKRRTVIQGRPLLNPGECWPFEGEQGHLFISLSHPVHITNVTLGHITKLQSPSGDIKSAPREFSVYGFTSTEGEGVFLGRQVYNPNGAAFQTFAMPNPDKGVFSYVKLEIENNWGHKDHTCVYNFKVHGKTLD